MKAHYFIPTQAVTTFFVFPFLQLIALYLASVDIGKGYRSGISLIGQGWFVNFFFQFGRKCQSHFRAVEFKGIQAKIAFCLVPKGLKQGGFVFPPFFFFLPKICCKVISKNSQNSASGIIRDQKFSTRLHFFNH